VKKERHELVVVMTAATTIQAEEARALLEGNELDAFVFDGHTLGLNPMLGGALGGVRVCVPDDQAEAARDVLRAARLL
jgi:hypothetical protein